MAATAIAEHAARAMQAGSWIREMFDRGRRLRADGRGPVYDFSLGNPNAAPPREFFDALHAVAVEDRPELHRYMPNAGFDPTRQAIASFLSREYQVDIDAAGVIVTSGSAGGLNVVLRSLCDPGDEVILLAPYFPEYLAYVANAAAKPVIVQTDPDFQPHLGRIRAAVTPRTRAIILNSPNNPSGAIFSADRMAQLGGWLDEVERSGQPLYAVLDDPYRRLVFDGSRAATLLGRAARAILVSSYSKDVSIAGERCGYVAVPRGSADRDALLAAFTLLNRTLGFVNASALMQRVIARCPDVLCDLSGYRRNRDRLCSGLQQIGYRLVVPGGGMFVFPQTPIADDVAFMGRLAEKRILVVPGVGFGRPGAMRISLAVEPEEIEAALPGFEAAFREVS